jgi:hypothetical protein
MYPDQSLELVRIRSWQGERALMQSIRELAAVLRGTPLEGRPIRQWWPSTSLIPVFTISVEQDCEVDEWSALRAALDKTGRYPVLSKQNWVDLIFLEAPPPASHFGHGDWVEDMAARALQVSHPGHFAEEASWHAYGPSRNDFFGWLEIPLDHWAHPLGRIRKRFGDAPSVDQMRGLLLSGELRTDGEIERWLLNWEVERFGDAALQPESIDYLDGFEIGQGEACVAVLLPTPEPWKALLYMDWYGLDGSNDERSLNRTAQKVAALRAWGDRYGAELVGSFVTSLEVSIKRRPQNIDEAFALALAHYQFASDILVLPGVSIRDHARALLSIDRWWFHSKP